jgi:hypothetical protein
MKFLVTFAATGGMTIEANSEDEAREKFNRPEFYMKAMEELSQAGIDVTDVSEEEE